MFTPPSLHLKATNLCPNTYKLFERFQGVGDWYHRCYSSARCAGECEDQNLQIRDVIVQEAITVDEIEEKPLRETDVVDDEVY